MPLHVLIENGYRDIIGIRLQGMGIERKVGIPEGVNVSIIEPRVKLGSSLGFDAEKSAYHIQMGYLDAQKLLYGLYGEGYYIDRTLTERRAYRLLAGAAVSYFRDMGTTVSLREIDRSANREFILAVEASKFLRSYVSWGSDEFEGFVKFIENDLFPMPYLTLPLKSYA